MTSPTSSNYELNHVLTKRARRSSSQHSLRPLFDQQMFFPGGFDDEATGSDNTSDWLNHFFSATSATVRTSSLFLFYRF
jgi:hypothetical protein